HLVRMSSCGDRQPVLPLEGRSVDLRALLVAPIAYLLLHLRCAGDLLTEQPQRTKTREQHYKARYSHHFVSLRRADPPDWELLDLRSFCEGAADAACPAGCSADPSPGFRRRSSKAWSRSIRLRNFSAFMRRRSAGVCFFDCSAQCFSRSRWLWLFT